MAKTERLPRRKVFVDHDHSVTTIPIPQVRQIILPASAKKDWDKREPAAPETPLDPIRSDIYKPAAAKAKKMEQQTQQTRIEARFSVGQSVFYNGGIARVKKVHSVERDPYHFYMLIICGVIFRAVPENQIQAIAPDEAA